MTKILAADRVKELNQYTVQHEPISSVDLVECAATTFVHEFYRRCSKWVRIVIFAGQGNNGADALAIARLLNRESYQVETYLFNPTEHLSVECGQSKQRLLDMEQIESTEVARNFEPPTLTGRDVVIDGLFGPGLDRPLTGGSAAMVDYINQSEAEVVAIDIPSGLFGEDNHKNDSKAIIKANLTLTLGFPELAFLLPRNEQYVGKWKILDIGIHPDAVYETASPYSLITEEDTSCSLKSRKRFVHKGAFGHALLTAGGRGKVGAALLSAKAYSRNGAELLATHTPTRSESISQTAFPGAVLGLDANPDYFFTIPKIGSYSAVGMGPGLGQHLESTTVIERILQSSIKPIAIDTDAINIMASNKDLFNKIPSRSIFTPHPKEFGRTAGESTNSYDRLMKTQSFAAEHKICIVLKGAYTAICSSAGNIYFNSCENPGMVTAGSGGVLTGIILSLLAQDCSPETTTVVEVFLHGTTGDPTAAFRSEESMIASDITDMLRKALKQIK